MLIRIEADDHRPVFRQIADEVKRCVSVGVLKPGDALPAIRKLGEDLKVNPNTVQHAYRTLEREQVVEVRRGLGTFIAEGARSQPRTRLAPLARQIVSRAISDALRQGLTVHDLKRALDEMAPGDERPA